MSAAVATAALPVSIPERPTPRLVEVVSTREQRRARPRAAYAIVSTAGVFAILLAQLLLSISLSEGAYRIAGLQSAATELDRNAQVLHESLDTLRSPQNLAANAESLGMVANASPAYLRMTDAVVLGAPIAAGAGAGLLQGRDSMIGNVLLADVPLLTPAPIGEVSGVSPGPTAPGSVASLTTAVAPASMELAAATTVATTIPSPITE
jgi:hypothetical protein